MNAWRTPHARTPNRAEPTWRYASVHRRVDAPETRAWTIAAAF